jgi:uncharacterized protein (TIGR02300 family)
VAKVELGAKRVCPHCGAKYYDLNRTPIVCPKCGTLFEATTGKARPQTAAPVPDEEEAEVEAADEVELVTLEEADEEAADVGAVKIDDDDDEIEADEEDDSTFLEEEEEEDDDVADIIGDVDDEEP